MSRRRAEISIGGALIYSLGRNTRQTGDVFSNSGGGFGNRFDPLSSASILLQDAWNFAGAGSDIVANVNPAKWSAASYLAGVAPTVFYDGAGNVSSNNGAGPPAVKLQSVPITYNVDKAHSLVVENCGVGTLSSAAAGQGNIAVQMESSSVFAGNGVIFAQGTTGLLTNKSDAKMQASLNGVLTTLTGSQWFISGATLKIIALAWNGTNRTIQYYLNGALFNQQVTTTRGVGTNNYLKIILGCADHQNTPSLTMGRVTFKGFVT